MLLGSSEQVRHRKKVKQQLRNMKFKKIIIMEDDDTLNDNNLDEKFASIVADQKPDFYFAIFHNNAKKVSGVVYEIGWLCGKFGSKNIADRLQFLFQEGYDFEKEKTTAYIRALFNRVTRVPFNEHKKYAKCSQIILTSFSIR